MSPELTNQITSKYPELFREHVHGDAPEIFFDLSHGDGWFALVNSICLSIQRHVKNLNDQLAWAKSRGLRLEEQPMEWPTVDQVKEKFGGLRFHVSGSDAYIDGVIALAETMSFNVCEICGNNGGRSSRKYWISTLCASCDQKRDSRDLVSGT